MAKKPALSEEQVAAFSTIGTLMTDWLGLLKQRSLDHNQEVDAKLAKVPRGIDAWERDHRLRKTLERSRAEILSIARLKLLVSGVGGSLPPVLAGSPRMDIGVAFMLLSNHMDARLPADVQVSEDIVRLARVAKGLPARGPIQDWLPEAIVIAASHIGDTVRRVRP